MESFLAATACALCVLSSTVTWSRGRVQIWVSDCTSSAKYEITCPIIKEKETHFGFKAIDNTDGSIAFRNLDFNQIYTAHCIAAVSI